jgi:carboxyl-terminal processing protease
MIAQRSNQLSPSFRVAAITVLISLLLSFNLAIGNAEGERRNPKSVSTSTEEGRLRVFDDAWEAIYERYYDPEFRGIDWELQRTQFRSEAAKARNERELYAVLRRMLGNLNDVHTRVFAPEEKFVWWNPRFVSIGLAAREIEGMPTVVRVEKNSAPERAGIKPGDIIESVDGSPALSLIDKRLSWHPNWAAGPSTRFRAFSGLFEGAPDTSLDLAWRTRTGELRRQTFERTWRGRQLGVRFRNERGKYLVIEIDAFTPSIALEFTRAMKRKAPKAHGIVLDLRGNGGGEAEAMADVASTFFGEGLDLGTFTDRWGVSFQIKTRGKSLLAAETFARTDLPLIVLVGERTSSAAEIFASAVQAHARGTVIGSQTCGCVLAIRSQHALPDGGALDISELDYKTSYGSRLQDNGIKPEENVVPLRSDLYAGRDRAIEHALDRLAQSINATPPQSPQQR